MSDTSIEPLGGRPSVAWRRLLDDAFAAAQQNLIHGSLRRALWVLAIPMVLEMSLEAVFAITDIFFVLSMTPALGPVGVFAAITVAEVLVALLAPWEFRRSRWQYVRV